MPRRTHAAAAEIPYEMELTLVMGPGAAGTVGQYDNEDLRVAWFHHGPQLRAETCLACTRPWAFWEFDREWIVPADVLNRWPVKRAAEDV